MAKMAQQMGGGMPGMGGGMGPPAAGGGSSSAQPGAASSSAVTAGAAANPMAGMAGMGGMDMANMDMGKGLDMMGSMSPDMMQAGMNMMKHARWLDTAPARCAHRAAPRGLAWPRLDRLAPPDILACPVARGWPMPRGQARTADRTAARAARAPRGAQGAGRGVSWGAGGWHLACPRHTRPRLSRPPGRWSPRRCIHIYPYISQEHGPQGDGLNEQDDGARGLRGRDGEDAVDDAPQPTAERAVLAAPQRATPASSGSERWAWPAPHAKGAAPSHTARAQRLRHRRQAAPKSPIPRLCFVTPGPT